MNKFTSICAVVLACTAIGIAPAQAKGPGWKANSGAPHGFSQGNKLGWGSANVPPGWSKGKKTGWGSDWTRPPGWR
jgi:hypothetical protein